MPSAVGYQPTLSTEMGSFQERIVATIQGCITSIQAIYVPADDLTDPAPVVIVVPWLKCCQEQLHLKLYTQLSIHLIPHHVMCLPVHQIGMGA